MRDGLNAWQLIASGDATLFAIVQLSLVVSLSAVAIAALIGLPLGALLALTRFPGRGVVIVVLNAFMGLPPVVVGLAGLSAAVAFRSARQFRHPVHAAGDGDRAGDPDPADHRRAVAPDHRGSLARVSRRTDGNGCRSGRPRRDAAVGRAPQPAHGVARGLRPRGSRSRRGDDRRRQHRRLHPHHDDDDRARDVERQPAAGAGARARSHRAGDCDQRRRLDACAPGPNGRRADDARAGQRSSRGVRPRLADRAAARPFSIASASPSSLARRRWWSGRTARARAALLRLCMGLASAEPKAASHGAAARMRSRRAAHSCFSGR